MADTGTPSVTTSVETIAGQITAAPHNTNYSDLSTKFNAHTHDLATDCVGDTELDAQRVRSIHASKKYALVSGYKVVSLTSGKGSGSITYASDSAQGNPTFTGGVTVVVGAPQGPSGLCLIDVVGPTEVTGFSVEVVACKDSGGDIVVDTAAPAAIVWWLAYGEVA